MSIGTRQILMQLDSLDLLLKDEHIKTVDSQKILGIIIDKSLTWDKRGLRLVEFRVTKFEFRVKIFEFRVKKFEFRVENFEFRVIS